jgi:hypothetical protein
MIIYFRSTCIRTDEDVDGHFDLMKRKSLKQATLLL